MEVDDAMDAQRYDDIIANCDASILYIKYFGIHITDSKMDSFDVLKVLEKFYVGRKILVFVHYGVGWFLRLDFELVREII